VSAHNFVNVAGGTAKVSIIGEVWEGMAAELFAALEEAQSAGPLDTVVMDIHSPGGSVPDGWRIFNGLTRLRSEGVRVVAEINTWALSMASVIACAADEVRISENGWMMIHRVWTSTSGDAAELRRAAEMMESMEQGILAVYTGRTGLPEEEVASMLAEETWLNAEQAIELGFADVVTDAVSVAACCSVDNLPANNPPAEFMSSAKPAKPAKSPTVSATDATPQSDEVELIEDDAAYAEALAACAEKLGIPAENLMILEVDAEAEEDGAGGADDATATDAGDGEGAENDAGFLSSLISQMSGAAKARQALEQAQNQLSTVQAEKAALEEELTDARKVVAQVDDLRTKLSAAMEAEQNATRTAVDLVAEATGLSADEAEDLPGATDAQAEPGVVATYRALPEGPERAAYAREHWTELQAAAADEQRALAALNPQA